MQLSRRRAELFGIRLEVIDKKPARLGHSGGDEKENAEGTTIILTIPEELKP
jgi:hypothetical protein